MFRLPSNSPGGIRLVQQQQSQLSLQEAHQGTQEKLAKVMPGYIERAVSRVSAKGVRFENIEPAMADYLRADKQYGLGWGHVSYQDSQKTIGVANDYVYYVKPVGYAEPFEPKGDMYWDLSTKGCVLWVDFSFNPSRSHPVGKYACTDFLAGKSDASFSSTFESAVRQGFEAR
jgi:hypothetical protein